MAKHGGVYQSDGQFVSSYPAVNSLLGNVIRSVGVCTGHPVSNITARQLRDGAGKKITPFTRGKCCLFSKMIFIITEFVFDRVRCVHA